MSEDGLESVISDLEAQLTEANATIAALRALLTKDNGESGWANSRPSCLSEFCTSTTCTVDSPGEHCAWERKVEAALAQPLPPAAAKLLAERDAGRALYEAVVGTAPVTTSIWQAVEAYRKVVE